MRVQITGQEFSFEGCQHDNKCFITRLFYWKISSWHRKNMLQHVFCKKQWDTTILFLVDNFFNLCSTKMINQFFSCNPFHNCFTIIVWKGFFSWRLTSSFLDAVWVYYWLFHLKTTFMTLSSHCPLHTFPFLVFCKVKLIRFMQQVSETETSS